MHYADAGGSGYLASEIVKQLLEAGYFVRATVRSASNLSRVQHLLDLAEALPGKLSLHEVRISAAHANLAASRRYAPMLCCQPSSVWPSTSRPESTGQARPACPGNLHLPLLEFLEQ